MAKMNIVLCCAGGFSTTMLMDRIKQKFYQAYPNSNVLFNYRIAPLSANAIVEEPQKPRRGRGRAAKGTAREKAAP